jgi:hypothetical protein
MQWRIRFRERPIRVSSHGSTCELGCDYDLRVRYESPGMRVLWAAMRRMDWRKKSQTYPHGLRRVTTPISSKVGFGGGRFEEACPAMHSLRN